MDQHLGGALAGALALQCAQQIEHQIVDLRALDLQRGLEGAGQRQPRPRLGFGLVERRAQVQHVLASGSLVSDDLMIDLVRTRLAEPDAVNGFVLDGFPRTIRQAEALDAMLGDRPLKVLLLVVPEAELERRLS